MDFRWTRDAQRDLKGLDKPIQNRIARKMRWFAAQNTPLTFAEPLTGTDGLYRYRIGAYRIIILPNGTVISILRIRKRAEA